MARNHTPVLEYIEWTDHGFGCGWVEAVDVDLTESMKKNTVRGVGWVIQENRRELCLATFIDERNATMARQYIVKSCIIKRRQLKVPK